MNSDHTRLAPRLPSPVPVQGGGHVSFDVSLDRVILPADGEEAKLECTLELRPSSELSIEQVRTSICLVFDCSRSMGGERIHAAANAARLIVDSAHERNTISLVAFSSKSHLLVAEQQATQQGKIAMREKIDTLADLVRGSTNMAAGIRRGMLAVRDSDADAKVMIVLSDGVADKPERAEAAALAASQAGIHLFAVGLGTHSGADQLLKLVAPSNGTVFEQKDAGKILLTFSNLLERIHRFVATQVYVDLKFGDGVVPKRLVRTSPERALIGIPQLPRLNVGNIEHNVTYNFQMALGVAPRAPGDFEVLGATLCYDVPSLSLRHQTQEVSVAVRYVAQRSTVAPVQEAMPAEYAPADRPTTERVEEPAASEEPAGPASEGATVYDVVLTDAGSDLILVLREVRDVTGLPLKHVMDLVRSGGGAIQEGLKDLAAAQAFKQRLGAAGAQVEVRSRRLPVTCHHRSHART